MIETRPHQFLGLQMAQNSYALIALNMVLTRLEPARILEIGTRCGGLTAFLGIYARQKKIPYWSYDITDQYLVDPDLLDFLEVCFLKQNVFEYEAEIGSFIREPGPSLVLCDGGNKPREFRVFSTYLKSGDVICAHDWPSEFWRPVPEIRPEDIMDLGLRPFCADPMGKAAWVCRRKP